MTKATKYKRKIKNVDYISVKQYLERNGWKVVLFNTPNGNILIDKLDLHEQAEQMDGFVYSMNCLRYVFINGQMSEKDRMVTLLHETGHIELEQDLTAPNKIDEACAWKFAYDVLFYQENVMKKIFDFIIFSLLAAAVIFACSSIANNIKNANQTVYVTPAGERYHTSDCYFVQDKETFSLKGKEAKKQYEPCAFCNPDK